jgi:hypothetical protein
MCLKKSCSIRNDPVSKPNNKPKEIVIDEEPMEAGS